MDENKDGEISPIRTYKGDVEELIKSGDGSLTKIAIAENDKKNAQLLVDDAPEHNHTKLIIIISLILILLGAGAIYYIYLYRNVILPQNTTTPIAEQGIIVTENEKIIKVSGLDRNKLIQLLSSEIKSQTGKPDSITDLKLTDDSGTKITTGSLFATLDTEIPDSLLRSLDDKYMLGVQTRSKNEPFLILRTNYYQGAYSGMLTWERTIKNDLGSIFFAPEVQVVATTSDNILKKYRDFEDLVYKNRDTRVLRDGYKKVTLIYSFPDKNTLVIATNPETLEQVITRILTKKLVQ